MKKRKDYISRNKDYKIHSFCGFPAVRIYYPSGKIRTMAWYDNGLPHRLNGPAYIWYFQDGSVLSSLYYINGEYFLSKSEWEIERNRIIMLNEIK